GGVDIDIQAVPERLEANYTALNNAYRSGLINVGNNLNKVAIIDCRGPDPALFHDAYRAFAIRARLEKAHGNYNNHVIYGGDLVVNADAKCLDISFHYMDRWLSNVEKDLSDLPIATKMAKHTPADVKAACITAGIINREHLRSTLRLAVS